VTPKGQTRDPNSLKVQYLENYLSYKDFKFGMQLCMGNAERAHKKISPKSGRGLSHVTPKFFGI